MKKDSLDNEVKKINEESSLNYAEDARALEEMDYKELAKRAGKKKVNVATIIKKIILYILLTLLAVTCLIPFLLMMVNATRAGTDIVKSFTLIPGNNLAKNWDVVMASKNVSMFRAMFNSVLVAVPATLLNAYFSSITAYAIATYKYKGRAFLFGIILVFQMIPSQLSLIGFYTLCSKLNITNTYIPLIVPGIAAAGTVFFLKQYVESVLPSSLLEAARIDGGKELYIFHRIVIPIMSPGIATMAIGAFIGSWNSYLLPMILITDKKWFTLPVMVSTINNDTRIANEYGALYLAVAISVIPILIVFSFCSRYIIGSITAGGVKE